MSPLTLNRVRVWYHVPVDDLLEVLPAVGTIALAQMYTYLLEVCNNSRSSRNYELVRSCASPNEAGLPSFAVMEHVRVR